VTRTQAMSPPLRRPTTADPRALLHLQGPLLKNSPVRLNITDWRIRGIHRRNDCSRPPTGHFP
jgi:hypothetical protein